MTHPLLGNAKLTPMLTQWLLAKEKSGDAILLFRMGDFYELFAGDAQKAAPILDLTLTSRDKGEDAVPMAGFPHQAAPAYIAKLVAAGLKVAVCDQLEDPKAAKGIVKRDITRIVTPGTVLDEDSLSAGGNNFLMALVCDSSYGLAALDVSTGDFVATVTQELSLVVDELSRFLPSELVLSASEEDFGIVSQALKERGLMDRMRLERRSLAANFRSHSFEHVDPLLLEPHFQVAWTAAQLALSYVEELQGSIPSHIAAPLPYSLDGHLLIDATTRRHLQLVGPKGNLREQGTLLWLLDRCKTAMGSRYLMRIIAAPSNDVVVINQRLDVIEAFIASPGARHTLGKALCHVYDMERLTGRIAAGRASPRDLVALRASLSYLPALKEALLASANPVLVTLADKVDTLEELHQLLDKAIVDAPPLLVKEGGVFKQGYDADLDALLTLGDGGRHKLAAIEQEERLSTGISSLKIGYTRVFGYYIEVTKTHLAKVPPHYRRKQTIANGERYVTEALLLLEEQVASAQLKQVAQEEHLYETLLAELTFFIKRLLRTAHLLARLDALASSADIADEKNYVRPVLLAKERRFADVVAGRHPVVEHMVGLKGETFVANDVSLRGDDKQIILITGPNMGGKSTLMRQLALIQIMAQAGLFVPASSAHLSICDRIFSRVGASDDLASGRSTFMVEMSESAYILRHATPYSLVLLDEVGRGTSTFDGLSIAWSMSEYMHDVVGARTLFATHYHELTDLQKRLARLSNAHVAVSERAGKIAFLYTLREGPAEQSYGVHVARLAGLPESVLFRAEQILKSLEKQKAPKRLLRGEDLPERPQLDLF